MLGENAFLAKEWFEVMNESQIIFVLQIVPYNITRVFAGEETLFFLISNEKSSIQKEPITIMLDSTVFTSSWPNWTCDKFNLIVSRRVSEYIIIH